MGVGKPLVGARRDRDRVDAIGERGRGNVAQIGKKLFEPAFEVQPVPKDEIGVTGAHDILRRRFIAVDFRAGLGDRDDLRCVPGDVPCHVGQHGEGGHGLEGGALPLSRCGGRDQRGRGQGQGKNIRVKRRIMKRLRVG